MEDIELPTIFPGPQELWSNMDRLIRHRAEESLRLSLEGVDEEDVGRVINSILHHDVTLQSPIVLLEGTSIVTQTFGALKNSETLINRVNGIGLNPLLNTSSLDTVKFDMNGVFCMVCKFSYSPSLERYLTGMPGVNVDREGDYAIVRWDLLTGPIGLRYLLDNALDALSIFKKLSTRFNSCRVYQNTLPGFASS